MTLEKTAWITFIGDRSVKIEEGQTVLEASLQAGIPHYHACGGLGQCSTCRVLVKEGMELLTEPNENEENIKTLFSFPPNVRLACQTFVHSGHVMVHRIIRDETDIALYIDEHTENSDSDMGVERVLALFFLDIRHFTPFIEAYLPFDVIHIMRRLFTLFRKCIEHYDGKIIETAGDGFYAVFGLDNENIKEAANKAVQAGHSIEEEINRFNDNYLQVHFNHRFEIGIGLHTGKAIVGNVGLGINNNLTAMGLAVNIASRLQAVTRQLNNSFIISHDVYRLVKDKHAEATSAKVALKGIKGEYKVYLVGKPYEEQ